MGASDMERRMRLVSGVITACVLATGCGSAKPTAELVSAREAYREAQQSEGIQHVPDRLLTAKQALDEAEEEHKDDARSQEERTLAYIAERLARLALAYGHIKAAEKELKTAQELYRRELERAHGRARGRLEDTEDSLGQTKGELDEVRNELAKQESELTDKKKKLLQREKELQAKKAQLEAKQEELEKERKAREEAEKRAAAAIASLEEIANVKEEKRGVVITLSGAVLFKSGQSGLLPIAEQQLKKVAVALLEQDEDKQIVVEGHTDSRGSRRSNRKLSQARAESVRVFLISQGVSADRTVAIGKGESEPVASNRTAEGRANNRRVEIVVKNE